MIRRLLAGTAAALLFALSACSSDAPPAESVPDLATRLQRVDAAVEAGDDAKARSALNALVARTAQAQVAGKISEEDAQRIFEAARDLLAELPGADVESPAQETPPTEPTVGEETGEPDEGASGTDTSGEDTSGEDTSGDDKKKDHDEEKDKHKDKGED